MRDATFVYSEVLYFRKPKSSALIEYFSANGNHSGMQTFVVIRAAWLYLFQRCCFESRPDLLFVDSSLRPALTFLF